MFNLKKIFENISFNKILTEDKRFATIYNNKVDKEVLIYLKSILQNLFISIENNKEEILALMEKDLLEGWCWQTTDTSILFFQDNDYIGRGFLRFAKNKFYFHSWICFDFNDEHYVFDPCLNIICKKELYYQIFEVNEQSKVEAQFVRNYFFEQIKNVANNKINIFGNDDINSPMFRNNTRYEYLVEDKNIRKLTANYYSKGLI